MDFRLTEQEVRVIGALIEKQITTPDYYPMTLNALIHACNQKNNRSPVVAYDDDTVSRALDLLREKKLAYVFYGSESRVAKYGHVFPKAYDLTPPDVAALCVLMLRGPQTIGEIRSRSVNFHDFTSLADVEATLDGLMTRGERSLVTRLPRLPGTKEPRYAHLLSGEVVLEAMEIPARSSSGATSSISALEETVSRLQQELTDLKEEFAQFRKQFD